MAEVTFTPALPKRSLEPPQEPAAPRNDYLRSQQPHSYVESMVQKKFHFSNVTLAEEQVAVKQFTKPTESYRGNLTVAG